MTRTAAGPQAQLVQGKRSWPAGTANTRGWPAGAAKEEQEELARRHS